MKKSNTKFFYNLFLPSSINYYCIINLFLFDFQFRLIQCLHIYHVNIYFVTATSVKLKICFVCVSTSLIAFILLQYFWYQAIFSFCILLLNFSLFWNSCRWITFTATTHAMMHYSLLFFYFWEIFSICKHIHDFHNSIKVYIKHRSMAETLSSVSISIKVDKWFLSCSFHVHFSRWFVEFHLQIAPNFWRWISNLCPYETIQYPWHQN